MRTIESVQVVVAFLLALLAALMSDNAQARHEISDFIAEGFQPLPFDLGTEPGFDVDGVSERSGKYTIGEAPFTAVSHQVH